MTVDIVKSYEKDNVGYTIADVSGVDISGGEFYVNQNGRYLELFLDTIYKDGELYVYLDNLGNHDENVKYFDINVSCNNSSDDFLYRKIELTSKRQNHIYTELKRIGCLIWVL